MTSKGDGDLFGTSARLAFGGLVLALALLVAAWTPVISPDSTYYLDTARQLTEGRGPVTYALHLGMPAVPSPAGFWPSLYPSVLGVALSLGLPPDRAPALVNAASVIALCLVLVRIGRRCLPTGWAWPAALLGVAHPLYASTLVSAWSEALFMVFVYAGLAVVLEVARSSTLPSSRRCAAAGLLAGAAFATRYAGIFLLAYLVLVLGLLAWRSRWRPTDAGRGLAVVAGAFALVAVPASYPNVRAYGSVFGMPRPPHPSIAHAALDRGRELAVAGGWLWLHAAALVALVVTVSVLTRAREVSSDEPARRAAGAWLLGGWIAFYLCALFASLLPYVRNEQLNGRFLAPVAPAAVLCVVRWLSRARAPAGAPVAALSALLALASFAYAAHDYRPGKVVDPVASWARDHASETSLFVGTGLWDLRYRTGAIVLTDGFPEMPRLEPGAVRDFLGGQGARFRTVHLVLGGAARTSSVSSVSSVSYERALDAVGFQLRSTSALEDGSTVVTLERTGGPASRAGGPSVDHGLLTAVRPPLVGVSPVR